MSDPQDRNAEEPVPVRYICPATWGGLRPPRFFAVVTQSINSAAPTL